MVGRIAAVADIHGNDLALRAVLHDIARARVDATVCLGDMVSGPLNAARTMELLMDLEFAAAISGNHDRWLVRDRDEMTQSDLAADAQLTDAHRGWLGGLPATARLDDVLLCHGTPGSDMVYWLETPTGDGRMALAEDALISERASGVHAPLTLCGHSHMPRAVRVTGGLIVNPGAVGLPAWFDREPIPHGVATGSPDASYAILERHEGTWKVELRRVPYDHMAMARLAADRDRPDWAHALATGRPLR